MPTPSKLEQGRPDIGLKIQKKLKNLKEKRKANTAPELPQFRGLETPPN